MSDNVETKERKGIDRRDFMKRGAIATGTVLWAAPVVQSFTNAAYAQTASPACECRFCSEVALPGGGTIVFVCTPETPEDCACLCCCAEGSGGPSCDDCPHPATPCQGNTIDCEPAPGNVCPF